MNDTKIVDLFWQRAEAAIVEASNKYAKYCHSIAYRILHSNDDAEECVNDTWFRAWNAMPPLRPNCLSTFLGKITRNLSLNRYEKLSAAKRGGCVAEIALSELEECVPSMTDVEREVEETYITDAINRFLDMIPTRHRDIFVQRYWYLSSITEISTELGISESNVKTILFRVRNKLRKHLEREGITI